MTNNLLIMRKHFFGLLFLALFITTFSCEKDEVDRVAIDQEIIEQYIADNNISAIKHESGIYYLIETEGTGGHPGPRDEVAVKYKGSLLDGTVFDQTNGSSANFNLPNLIVGWQIGIRLLQKGGKGTFIIPSYLGYGRFPPAGIPENAVLIFDIELIDFG